MVREGLLSASGERRSALRLMALRRTAATRPRQTPPMQATGGRASPAEAGADVNSAQGDGMTALHWAA